MVLRAHRSVTIGPVLRAGPILRFAPIARIVALVLLPGAMVASGCGESFDRADAIDSFLAANPEVDRPGAECVIDRQIDRYGLEGLATELQAEPESEAFTEAQFQDMFACGLAGDVTDQLVEQLQASGVDPDDAPCVAQALTGDLDDDDIDVLLSGEITDSFMSKFVTAMESCGAADG